MVAYREGMIEESKIAERYRALGPELERASAAVVGGVGGTFAWAWWDRCGCAGDGDQQNTVVRGIAEVREGARLDAGRVRRAGAGRPRLTESDPGVVAALEALVIPDTRGGSAVAVAVVLEELAEHRGGVGRCRSSDF